jgi:hypothetical protein
VTIPVLSHPVPDPSDWHKKRAKKAAAVRHKASPEILEQAARDELEARLALRVRQLVDAAPPLSIEQRARLASLLMGPAA